MRVVSSAELSGLQTRRRHSLGPVLLLLRSSGLGTLSVSVLYLSCQMSESAHSAGTLTSASLGLERPIVAANFA